MQVFNRRNRSGFRVGMEETDKLLSVFLHGEEGAGPLSGIEGKGVLRRRMDVSDFRNTIYTARSIRSA